MFEFFSRRSFEHHRGLGLPQQGPGSAVWVCLARSSWRLPVPLQLRHFAIASCRQHPNVCRNVRDKVEHLELDPEGCTVAVEWLKRWGWFRLKLKVVFNELLAQIWADFLVSKKGSIALTLRFTYVWWNNQSETHLGKFSRGWTRTQERWPWNQWGFAKWAGMADSALCWGDSVSWDALGGWIQWIHEIIHLAWLELWAEKLCNLSDVLDLQITIYFNISQSSQL